MNQASPRAQVIVLQNYRQRMLRNLNAQEEKRRRREKMLELYLELVKSGKLTLDQIPDFWRSAVQQALNEADQA